MDRLPGMTDVGQYRQQVVAFKGLNRTEGCAEGEFSDMQNLACRSYPVMATRKGRVLVEEYAAPDDLFEWNGHRVVVDGTTLYYDGEAVCTVATGQKQFAVVNTKLVVWPDGLLIDLTNGKISTMSGAVTSAAGTTNTLTATTLTMQLDQIVSSLSQNTFTWYLASSTPAVEMHDYITSYDTDDIAFAGGVWTLTDGVEIDTIGFSSTLVGRAVMLADTEVEGSYVICTRRVQSSGGTAIAGEGHGYEAANSHGYYGVITGAWASSESPGYREVEYTGTLTIEVHNASNANVAFGKLFTVGDRVTLEGTLGTLNDVECKKITAIDSENNCLSFEEGTLIVPSYYYAITQELAAGKYYLLTGQTRVSFAATEPIRSGSMLFYASEQIIAAVDGERTVYAVDGTSQSNPSGYTQIGTMTAYEGETGTITVQRDIPALDFICARNNRLYGVSNSVESKVYNTSTGSYDTFTSRCIYVSALGLPARFWDFDGTDADSYQVAVASNNDFTGICAYGDYVLCWKEDELTQLYGDYPSNFGYNTMHIAGVQAGSHRSMQIINEVLYYKGRDGVYAYALSTPSLISYNLGHRAYTGAVAGADGIHYHICMADEDGAYDLYTYDTVHGLWMREDNAEVKAFSLIGGVLYAIIGTGLWAIERDSLEVDGETMTAAPVEWYAVFPATQEGTFDRKDYKRIRLRLELGDAWEENGQTVQPSVAVSSRLDGGLWRTHRTITGSGRRVCEVPLPLSRADQIEIKLSGRGGCRLEGFAREFVEGSATH